MTVICFSDPSHPDRCKMKSHSIFTLNIPDGDSNIRCKAQNRGCYPREEEFENNVLYYLM